MKPFRLHSVLPALLALSLVLTAATPLVRHACGMTEAEMAAMPCCEGESHDAPAHPMPEAPPCHDAPTEHEVPAPEAPASHDCPDAHHTTAIHATCCAAVATPAAPVPERFELLPTVLPALVAAFALPPEPPPSPPRFGSDLPPPAPVALHVLFERFLI